MNNFLLAQNSKFSIHYKQLWRSVFLLVLLALYQDTVFPQYQTALPLVPIASDREQIQSLLANLDRSLNNEDLHGTLEMLGVPSFDASSLPVFCSLDIGTIDIGKNTASALCKLRDRQGSMSKDVEIYFEKKGLSWQIKEGSPFVKAVQSIRKGNKTIASNGKQSAESFAQSGNRTILTQASLRTSSKILVNIPHPYTTDGVTLINENYTLDNLSRKLFAQDARFDIDAILLDANSDNAVAFNLDPFWSRIIYANKNIGWIRSYGDNPNDYRFMHPRGMTVDGHDTLYVADTDNNLIVKLYLDHPQGGFLNSIVTGYLHYISSISVPGMIHPVDVAIDMGGTASGSPQNDHIWIADDFGGQLIDIHRDGQVYQRITQYSAGLGTFKLSKPLRVETQENDRVAFIDYERNAFVIVNRPLPSTESAVAINSTEFDKSTCELTCIGQDINSEWWVGDKKQKMYHHFTTGGGYLASYTPGLFSSPVTATKSPYLFNGNPPYRSQYVYTSDLWGTTTGMRAFTPGTDAINITNAGGTQCNTYFNFILMNKSYAKATLFLQSYSGNSVVATYDYGVLEAGSQTVAVDRFKMGNAQYIFQLELKPYYGSTYWNFTYSWVNTAPIGFGASIAPVSSTKNCFKLGETGLWEVTPACPEPNGFYSYQWFKNSSPGSTDWTQIGGNNKRVSYYISNESFELKCIVTNNVIGGASAITYYRNCPPPPPPPACPYVYTWDGTRFIEDNNILPQSEYSENQGNDVTDYYRLLKPLSATNGSYILQIREFEHERSYLDQFKLLAVDHPINTKIDVSPAGEIYQYIIPYRLGRALLRGSDILSKLAAFDSNTVTMEAGDTLHLSLTQLTGKAPPTLFTTSGGGEEGGYVPIKIEKIAYITRPMSAEGYNQSFTFRQRPTLVFVPMTLDSTQSLNVVWTKKAHLDYFNFGVTVPKSYTMRELVLSSATHSINGDVTPKLLSTDSTYATLTPGQTLELRFNAIPPPPSIMKRTFIIVSKGRYERIPDSTGAGNTSGEQPREAQVTTFKLHRNYPNPFNPLTRIDFQLPVDGHSTIVVYDLIGREIARLIDRDIAKGFHSVEWDASAQSSGMYFCRFVVTDTYGKLLYTEVQKLLVVR
ncbi:MAG: hypothetical protein HYR76_09760 [Ignavibacteria bacterium]|nr:hypothetical protein [Ignavibacteria bacterium]